MFLQMNIFICLNPKFFEELIKNHRHLLQIGISLFINLMQLGISDLNLIFLRLAYYICFIYT
uniref:Uncharacterized protein n=1 Tax=Grateloupia filicina TaxID=31455 RepID=A0A2S1FXE7_9FLOR|nr:hypothetical protein Grafi_p107 [Grateloupia filicina]AWD77445.1 hypothetical protein Grafi_p107 [Grateloupia filicina]